MKRTFSAAELKQLALRREIMPPCEMRSFSAKHEGSLSSVNHVPFVEAFLLTNTFYTLVAADMAPPPPFSAHPGLTSPPLPRLTANTSGSPH